MNDLELRILYFEVTDIWKEFCELHNELLDKTCEEYALLLGSEVDQLERNIQQKKHLINKINILEERRSEVIKILNEKSTNSVTSISDLLKFFKASAPEKEGGHLAKFNSLLLDLINKIQEQNKKNQSFINKALKSLRDIREDATGAKSYQVYNAKGKSSIKTVQT